MELTQSQRGSMVIYAMLMMFVFLAIGMSLISLFVGRLTTAGQMKNAIQALYIADSSVELCLFEARQNTNEPPLTWPSGSRYQIVNLSNSSDITNNCSGLGTGAFTFRAIGTVGGVRRALDIAQ
jgi:hypothetical protein